MDKGMNSMLTVRCRRRGLLEAAAAFVCSAALPVCVIGAAQPARAEEDQAIIQPIQQLVDGLVEIMKAGSAGTPVSQRFEMFAPIIDRTFDLRIILEESVGATWPTLAPEQQQMLAQAFRRYTVASYVNSFDQYKGQRFGVQPETRPVGN